MNSLIVFESFFGNTERVAQTIADTLKQSGQVTTIRVSPDLPLDLTSVDLLLLGCPIISWKPSVGMQAFMGKISPLEIRGKTFACFDTRVRGPKWIVGDACEGMTAQLSSMGGRALTPPEKFFVRSKQGPLEKTELEHAVSWAGELAKLLSGTTK